MDIYSFINSRDIAEHCRKIGHEFTPLEMAVIINLSKECITKKHEGYIWLIENTPDCEVPERTNCNYFSSLHNLLRELMYIENRIDELFKKQEPEYCYHMNIYEENTCDDDNIYLSWEEAVKDATNNNSMISFSIEKRRFDDAVNETGAIVYLVYYYNNNGEPITYWANKGYFTEEEIRVSIALDNIYIDIPMPFENGDLITRKGLNAVYVLHNTPQPELKKERDRERQAYYWDSTDIMVNGYFLTENGLCFDHLHTLDLEYYKGELLGYDRFLKFLSLYIKDESDCSLFTLFREYDIMRKNGSMKEINDFYSCAEDFFKI